MDGWMALLAVAPPTLFYLFYFNVITIIATYFSTMLMFRLCLYYLLRIIYLDFQTLVTSISVIGQYRQIK